MGTPMLTSRLALMTALVAATAFATTSAAPAQPAGAPRIVALGDSLTSGHGIGVAQAYPAILQARLAAAGFKYQVVNAGISGDTSTGAVRRLAGALRGDVRVLIVAIGANDGLRAQPVDALKSNVSRIVETAHARGISVVLCGMEAPPTRGAAYTTAFRTAFYDVAARFRVPFVPFLLQNVITDPAMLLPDRAHPNPAGAHQIAENIWPTLEMVVRALAAQPLDGSS
jgi:acyl-CoA thioesterase-1